MVYYIMTICVSFFMLLYIDGTVQVDANPVPTNRFIHVTDVVRPPSLETFSLRSRSYLAAADDGAARGSHVPPPPPEMGSHSNSITVRGRRGSHVQQTSPPPPPIHKPTYIHIKYYFWSQKKNPDIFQHKTTNLN